MIEQTAVGLKVLLPVPFAEAVERATAALKAQGFGVLTTIDMQQAMREKLNREFRKYVILGACNPPLAYRALSTDLEIGLLLPCNVVVHEVTPHETAVIAMAPIAALGLVPGNAELASVAQEADSRLRAALDTLMAAA